MIHIITPCSRPENLPRMSKSIDKYRRDALWHICFDTSKISPPSIPDNLRKIESINSISGGVSGNLQRNVILKLIRENFPGDDWVFVLDDDNLLHQNFIKLTHNFLDRYPNTNFFTWDQELQNGTIRPGNDPRVCHIDQAQFMVRVRVAEDYVQRYEADGIFIEAGIKKNPESWVYLPEVLSFYNRLRWDI